MSDTTVPEPLEAKKFQCEICKKMYRKKYFLLDHARKVHGGKIREFFYPFLVFDSTWNQNFPDTTFKWFDCEECGKKFGSSTSYKRHKLVQHSEKYTCEVCSEVFSNETIYKRHYIRFHAKKNLKCDHCGKSFSKMEYLKKGRYVGYFRAHRKPCKLVGKQVLATRFTNKRSISRKACSWDTLENAT